MNKGKYATNDFYGREGAQGPYKLIGNNGESYIIILSGTERIFVNGKKLRRGIENDYIIDYNASEITFTNKFFITENTRIHVEFEYNNTLYMINQFFNDLPRIFCTTFNHESLHFISRFECVKI